MMDIKNPLQNRIMSIVDSWVREQKQPILQRHIVIQLAEQEIPPTTIKAAMRTLVRKGYLRKGIALGSYVQLRSL